jgi:hypothetical protein
LTSGDGAQQRRREDGSVAPPLRQRSSASDRERALGAREASENNVIIYLFYGVLRCVDVTVVNPVSSVGRAFDS